MSRKVVAAVAVVCILAGCLLGAVMSRSTTMTTTLYLTSTKVVEKTVTKTVSFNSTAVRTVTLPTTRTVTVERTVTVNRTVTVTRTLSPIERLTKIYGGLEVHYHYMPGQPGYSYLYALGPIDHLVRRYCGAWRGKLPPPKSPVNEFILVFHQPYNTSTGEIKCIELGGQMGGRYPLSLQAWALPWEAKGLVLFYVEGDDYPIKLYPIGLKPQTESYVLFMEVESDRYAIGVDYSMKLWTVTLEEFDEAKASMPDKVTSEILVEIFNGKVAENPAPDPFSSTIALRPGEKRLLIGADGEPFEGIRIKAVLIAYSMRIYFLEEPPEEGEAPATKIRVHLRYYYFFPQ